jgi:hypothetical protein
MSDSIRVLRESLPGLNDLAGLVSDRARAEFVEISSMLAWADRAEAELRAQHDGFLLHEELAALPAIIGERTHLSRGQVAHRLGAAERIRDKTPKVWRAFSLGRIDFARVREISSAVEQLERPRSIERLDNRVIDYAERHTVAELRRWLKLFVANVESDLFTERAEDERKNRGIEITHGDDAMGWLSIYAPSLRIAAVNSRLTKIATALGNDGRTLEQRKADLALAWLSTGELDGIDIRAEVAVTVPAVALAGGNNTPTVSFDGSWVAPPAWIAELAAAADTFWHRMVLDPVTDDVLAHEYLGRYSSHVLTMAMAFRDGVCQAPGCLKPALECDQDHRIPHEDDGPTTGFNMGPLCRCDHRRKGHGILTWSWIPDPRTQAA